MNFAIDAIYEGGKLRPLAPLTLPENTFVRISVETADNDAGRREWLSQGKHKLMETWDNEADEVYNALLTK